MQLVTLILKKEEILDDLLKQLAQNNITGGTIIDGTGMAEKLVNMEDLPMFGLLRRALKDEEKETCKILMLVLKDEYAVVARDLIKHAINLHAANTGIMFVVPITYVTGIED